METKTEWQYRAEISRAWKLVDQYRQAFEDLSTKLAEVERQRPRWAKGYSTDSIAAQVSEGALAELWELMGVSNQTDAVEKLQGLVAMESLKAAPIKAVAAQHRFRHPQKGIPDWSSWQPEEVNYKRLSHEIDSQGYQVEYRLLYERSVPAYKPTRITEQDAREIVFQFTDFSSLPLPLSEKFSKWFDHKGRTLLNKLNADREQVPAVAVPDGWKLVPVEPSQKQIESMMDVRVSFGEDINLNSRKTKLSQGEALVVYYKVIAAAPSHSQQSARTPQDYAIEHAEYMAVNGEQLIEYLNEISDAEEGVLVPDDRFGDYVQGLRCGIQDFRKRRDRCPSHESE